MHVIIQQRRPLGATTVIPGHWSEQKSSADVQYWIPAVTKTVPEPSKPAVTPAPSSAPDTTSACNMLWNQLVGQAPAYIQKCITYPTHKRVFDGICARIGSGQTTLQSGAAQWAGYVAQNCPPPVTPPPAQAKAPPPPAAPPPPPTSQPTVPPTIDQDTPGSGSPSGDVGDHEEPGHEEDKGYLRQVGSIVGIGLILAVGLTYARKKGMLTKRRSRR